jgi:hypothetical protein
MIDAKGAISTVAGDGNPPGVVTVTDVCCSR